MLRRTAVPLRLKLSLMQHIWILYTMSRCFGFIQFSYDSTLNHVNKTNRCWQFQHFYFICINWTLIVIAILGIASDIYSTVQLLLLAPDHISNYRAQSLLMTFSLTNIVGFSIVSMCRICLRHEPRLMNAVNLLLQLVHSMRYHTFNDARMRSDFLKYLYLRWSIVILMAAALRPALMLSPYVLLFLLYYGLLYELFYYAFILFNLLILILYHNLNVRLSRMLNNCDLSSIDKVIMLHRQIEQIRYMVCSISMPYLLCIYIRVMISSFEVYVAAICLFFREYSEPRPRSNRFLQAVSFVVLQFFDVAIISHLGNKLHRTQQIFLDLLSMSSMKLAGRSSRMAWTTCDTQNTVDQRIRELDSAILFSKTYVSKIAGFNLFTFERSNILEFVNTVVSITVTAVQYSISEQDVIDKRGTCPG